MTPALVKAAEVASGLGAIVLGAGLALLAPEALRGLGIPLLAAGVLVHGVGMSLKHRFEQRRRQPFWWETALFWICWVCLGAIAASLPIRFLAS